MKRASPGDNPGPKRAKASQACASCRRQKSRCEILDVRPQPGAPVVTIRCHRCKTLGVQCSFETSDLIHFLPKAPAQTPPDASPSVSDQSSPPEIYGGLNTLAAVASSQPNAEAVSMNSIQGRHEMLPEDLLPTATTPVWGSVSRVDWTATPMLAIQELVRCPRTDSGSELANVGRLEDILSLPEITSLLEIFETRYSPWLCAQPESVEYTNSMLDIVRCTIASRHLGPVARSTIAPRLQKLTEDVFVREIFNPQPPIESIKALLILSVWAPICGTGAEARDGRLLIASAVSMAMNLHLQNESKRSLGLRADKDGLGPEKQAELDESTRRWRLWMYLSISESMLCIGTGRAPVSHISQSDHDMTNLTTLPDFTLPVIRDSRLGLSAKLLQMAETAFKTRLKSAKDLSSFFQTTNTCIYAMDDLGRLVNPLPILTQHDAFHSQMLILQYHSCRLLMMHHVLRETRTVHERDTPLIPWYHVKAEGHPEPVAIHFGRVALTSAEAVLTAFLTPSDLTQLSTAPDNLYVMVGFAATWIFVTNFSIYQLDGGKMGGASERLQAMAVERLNQISHAPDHSAGRCGHVLGALLRAWEQRTPRTSTNGCHYDMDIPYELPVGPPAYEQNNGDSNEHLAPPDHEFANPDLFMDDAFWSSFVQNLNSDTFIAQNPPIM
ncbi:hypothetical protein B0H17DRAFT_11228 [Mycena rosella]|uniref:Zn(2)-C6 fungal-type domain-containing protein n=1 Tax=Mycena rosella TaxID=1033263 RepID=A0AAD7GSW1_MYCRO|nr:hypothetical protein B0H17DRAFT_11228 [Mycena rosella]